MKLRVYQKYTFFCLYEHETHPPSPSLKAKGRGVINYCKTNYTLPLLFKGRVGVGLRKKK